MILIMNNRDLSRVSCLRSNMRCARTVNYSYVQNNHKQIEPKCVPNYRYCTSSNERNDRGSGWSDNADCPVLPNYVYIYVYFIYSLNKLPNYVYIYVYFIYSQKILPNYLYIYVYFIYSLNKLPNYVYIYVYFIYSLKILPNYVYIYVYFIYSLTIRQNSNAVLHI
jgi:hypothetical protein